MPTLKERIERLEGYGFTDKHGHPLENCVDFMNLKAFTETVFSIGSFGWALEQMKSGKRVARFKWYSKGMWLRLVHPEDVRTCSDFWGEEVNADPPCLLSWIGMKTAGYCFVPWLASQTDMLAEDWEIIE